MLSVTNTGDVRLASSRRRSAASRAANRLAGLIGAEARWARKQAARAEPALRYSVPQVSSVRCSAGAGRVPRERK